MATAYAPGFPLPLRNALAHLVIGALDADGVRRALAWVATLEEPAPDAIRSTLADVHLVEPDGRLLAVHRPHEDRVRAHAARALRAAAAYAPPAESTPVGRAVAQAVALWNERLFFEVHEVLEAVWKTATGAERQALQGVIQIGVAFHHHAHGNLRGARTLMTEGRQRLATARHALPALDVGALLDATAAWQAALAAGTAARDAPPPAIARTPTRDTSRVGEEREG
jgi:predicted metal-dependent hydrolase